MTLANKVKDGLHDLSCTTYSLLHKKSNKKRLFSRKTRERMFIVGMLALPVLHFLVFWVYVNIDSMLLAFRQIDLVNGGYYFTLDNFKSVIEILGQPGSILQESLRNTLIFWAFHVFIMFPLSVFVAYFIFKRVKGHRIFTVIFYLPGIISSVALAALFKYEISAQGPIGWFLTTVIKAERVPAFLLESEYALNTLLVYSLWTGLAGSLLLHCGGMHRIPKDIFESAALEGIGMRRELFNIVIPLLWPTLSTLILFQFVGIFSASGAILLLTQGAGQTSTLGYYIFMQVRGAQFFVPSALGWFFTIIALPIVFLVRFLLNKVYADVEF
jgi:ABC-type sugar transport system permease subunit